MPYQPPLIPHIVFRAVRDFNPDVQILLHVAQPENACKLKLEQEKKSA